MKLNILVLGAGGNASRNYIKSLRLNKDFIGKIIGTDISLNATYVSNADKCYLIKESDKLNSINEIIENEQIDYVHAQPDSEVQFISKNSSQINAKTLNIKKEFIKKYGNKEFTNQMWSEKFGSFETYSYVDILENNELFENCISKNGIAWVRKSYGAGSSGALPVNTIKQLHDWINFLVEFKKSNLEDFIVSEYLPGKEFAVQVLFWKGELIHYQPRERLEYFFAKQMVSGQSSTPSIARTVVNKNLKDITLDAIKTIEPNPHGIYCVDLKENNDSSIVPMEVNYGRFFTTSYFFSKLNVNTPLDVIKKSFDLSVEPKIEYLKANIYCYRGLDMEMKIIDRSNEEF
jgi:carbamoyl-phosphate synthase large subunit